jgi:ribosome-binding protein aMBF1 (putative translation factor)
MGMSEERKAELESKGVIFTTVEEFLGLDEADAQVVEMRVRIAREVRRRREAAGLSQKALAERMGVSQPRIPAIESGASPTLDSVVLAFFAAGGKLDDLAEVIAGRR